jgi:hypothetical protein
MPFGTGGRGTIFKRWNTGFSTIQDSRIHCQLSPPSEEVLDFMSPLKQRQINTVPFHILSEGTKGKDSFKDALDSDMINCKSYLEVGNLKSIFHTLEPALKVRGLLSPFSLQDERSQGLHWAYKWTFNKVVYLTSYDLVKNMECMPRLSKRPFLDYLCDEHVIITPDWMSMDTSITHSLYDHGLKCPPYDRHLHKGESDASYNKDKGYARIGMIIWNKDQVMWCEVLDEVKCQFSVEAEALAMCLLLKRAIQLSIFSLEVCTDNSEVDRVVRGEQIFSDSDKFCDLYNLLRVLRGHFNELICRWVPRENIYFTDGLLRNEKLFRNTHGVIGSTCTDKSMARSILRNWKPHLNGDPFFSIKERKSYLRKKGNYYDPIFVFYHCLKVL